MTATPLSGTDWVEAHHFLEAHNLYSPSLSKEQALARFRRFSGLRFGEQVSAINRAKYMQQLLPYEQVFADSQDAIGDVTAFPFRIEVADHRPIHVRAISYPPEARAWLRDECNNLVKRGVIEKVPPGGREPLFVCNIVLVKEGQTGQKYRMCYNGVPVNARTKLSYHHVPDYTTVIDELYNAKYLSMIDLKGAFLNIHCAPESMAFLGFVTQDGLYYFKRMPFGTINAPAHLQSTLQHIIHEDGHIATEIFYDDVTPHGMTEEDTWKPTIKTIEKFWKYKFLINPKKTVLLTPSGKLLGHWIASGNYQLGEKALAKLFNTAIPRSYRHVQEIMGRLNFCSRMLPDYKRLIKPIQQLLSTTAEPKWTAECTAALNKVYGLASRRLALKIYDPSVPLLMYYSHDQEYCEVTLTQPTATGEVPIKIMSRELTATERSRYTPVEQAMSILQWGICKAHRYTAFHHAIVVYVRQQEYLMLLQQPMPHPKVQSFLINFGMYQVTFAYKPTDWDFAGYMARATKPDHLQVPSTELAIPPTLQHHDSTILPPATSTSRKLHRRPIKLEGKWRAYFDGASMGKKPRLAGGGFVAYDQDDKLKLGQALLFGEGTNNEAEAQACLSLLTALQFAVPPGATCIVHGDSLLIMSFLAKINVPKKRSLLDIINQCLSIVDKVPFTILYVHLPRAENAQADALAGWALKHRTSADISTINPTASRTQSEPICATLASPLTGPQDGPSDQDLHCIHCGATVGQASAYHRCWGCDACLHHYCAALHDRSFASSRLRPWHCRGCLHRLSDKLDVTLDDQALRYLVDGLVPEDPHVLERVEHLARFLWWEDGKLFIRGREGSKQIPPIRERERLIQEVLRNMGSPGADRVHMLLRSQFWWAGMKQEVKKHADATNARQFERAKFKPPPYMFPIPKGRGPFVTWAVDCITNLQPVASNGGKALVVAVDAWSKWVEGAIINPLDSRETSAFLYNNVIARYGVPASVRVDSGREFMGDFRRLCKQLGIAVAQISTLHPNANGQIERINREIKSFFIRIFTLVPGANWDEVLPDVLMAMRLLPSTTTLQSPYELVYKQQPRLPLPVAIALDPPTEASFTTDWDDPATFTAFNQALERLWDALQPIITKRLEAADSRLERTYVKRTDLAAIDVRFAFEPGMLVMHKQKRPGKLQLRALGPYTFIQYHGPKKLTATIQDAKQRKLRCSVANLLPMTAEPESARLLRISHQPQPPDEPMEIQLPDDLPGDLEVPYEEDEEVEALTLKRARPWSPNWDRDIWPSDND